MSSTYILQSCLQRGVPVRKLCWRMAAVKIPFVEPVIQSCTFVDSLADLSRGNNQICLRVSNPLFLSSLLSSRAQLLLAEDKRSKQCSCYPALLDAVIEMRCSVGSKGVLHPNFFKPITRKEDIFHVLSCFSPSFLSQLCSHWLFFA